MAMPDDDLTGARLREALPLVVQNVSLINSVGERNLRSLHAALSPDLFQALPVHSLQSLQLDVADIPAEPGAAGAVVRALAGLTALTALLAVDYKRSYLEPQSCDGLVATCGFNNLTQLRRLQAGYVHDCNCLRNLPGQLQQLNLDMAGDADGVGYVVNSLQLTHLTACTSLALDHCVLGAEVQLPCQLKHLSITDFVSADPLPALTDLQVLHSSGSSAGAHELHKIGSRLSQLTEVKLSYWRGRSLHPATAAAAGWGALPLCSLQVGGFHQSGAEYFSGDTCSIPPYFVTATLSRLVSLASLSLWDATLRNTSHQQLAAALKALTKLTCLEMGRLQFEGAGPEAAVPHVPVAAANHSVAADAAVMPSMVHLLGEAAVSRAVGSLTQLKSLEVGLSLPDDAAVQLASSLGRLQQLAELSFFGTGLSDFGFINIIKHCSNLLSLGFWYEAELTDAALAALAYARIPKVWHMVLSNMDGVTDLGVRVLGRLPEGDLILFELPNASPDVMDELQQAGKEEEKRCRFCRQVLQDWKPHMMNGHKVSTPYMRVSFNGKTHKVQVRPGEEGMKDFEVQIRKMLQLPEDQDFDVIFHCRAPGSGDKLQLQGLCAFDAAVHCASMTNWAATSSQNAEGNKQQRNRTKVGFVRQLLQQVCSRLDMALGMAMPLA
eukprot:gene11857-12001_t